MKKRYIGFLFLLLLLCPCFTVHTASAASPVAKWGRLQVKGTQIVSDKGKKVQLKGVSTHGIAWFPQYVNKSSFASMKRMGVNTIRLAFYSDPAAGYDAGLYKKVEEGIQAATGLGMYVVLDWHILSDGNPKIYEKNAGKFFTYFSRKYGKQKNILYEICNEPNGNVTWAKDIKPYARRIIKKIRKYDKKNIIIAGSSTWSQDVDQTAKSPLKGKNIAYSLHFYAATHKENLQQKLKTAYKAGLPILVTEFSICDASGNGAIDKSSGKKWIKLLKKYKIGFIAWSLCNKQESASLIKASCSKTGNFKKSDLSKTGKWILAQMK